MVMRRRQFMLKPRHESMCMRICRRNMKDSKRRINKRIATKSRSIASFLSLSLSLLQHFDGHRCRFAVCISQHFLVTDSQFLHRYVSAGIWSGPAFYSRSLHFSCSMISFHSYLFNDTCYRFVALRRVPFIRQSMGKIQINIHLTLYVCVWPWSLLTAPRPRSLIRSHSSDSFFRSFSVVFFFFTWNCNLCNVYGYVHNRIITEFNA